MKRVSYLLFFLITLSGCPKNSDGNRVGADNLASAAPANGSTTSTTVPAAPVPRLSSVSPSNVLSTGGATLSLKGERFVDGMIATIDGGTVDCKFVSDAQFDCIAPALTAGAHDVAIQASTLKAALTVVDPLSIAQVAPTSGSTAGGFTVTLAGKGFADGLKVSIGGIPCAPVVVTSTTAASCTAGAGLIGQWSIKLEGRDNQVVSLLNAFTYGTPDTWRATSQNGAPDPRDNVEMVWTGTKILTWGGSFYPNSVNTGGQYDVAADRWSAITTTNAPSARNVRLIWTGTRMIVWGGRGLSSSQPETYTGGMYDPNTNTWTATSISGVPTARDGHAALWTGDRMLVWGGRGNGMLFNTGGIFDPVKNAWTTITTKDAPTARTSMCAVWTGKKMIVWGGGATKDADIGGIYDPATDTWKTISKLSAPSIGNYQGAFWTGKKMIVWSYVTPDANNTGIYDPATDTWSELNLAGAPPRNTSFHTWTWSGTKLFVWGGMEFDPNNMNNFRWVNDGYAYDATADSWTKISSNNAPSTRGLNGIVWAGSRLLIWGGATNGNQINTGGFYIP